jgi:hypothetical protein
MQRPILHLPVRVRRDWHNPFRKRGSGRYVRPQPLLYHGPPLPAILGAPTTLSRIRGPCGTLAGILMAVDVER